MRVALQTSADPGTNEAAEAASRRRATVDYFVGVPSLAGAG